ncbi:MAG: cupin domain-containing protein [Candidatus Manganitrophaceae bacterium]
MALSIDRWEKPGEPAEKVALEKELKTRGYRPEFWVDKPGTTYRNRRHETNTLLWILRGEARITIGADTDTLHDGDRIALPPHTPYTLQVLGDKILLWLIGQKKKGG